MFTYFYTNQFPNAKLQSTEVKVCTAGGRGSFSTISGSRSCIAETVSVVYPRILQYGSGTPPKSSGWVGGAPKLIS